ncbi:MAG TPA: FAD-dependent oxidoreductase [Acidimicrobiales bacterium]|jgi:thioredoxin reductase/SAM-dependent methyltransferase|nr:FAD-dependent oxidoreductase [Acidimicrobiales bacterium]
MTDHHHQGQHQGVLRHCDVCVIGGSAAGLAAALQLGRQRRSVIVVDDRTPRNAPAAHMHSFLTNEGRPPAELTAAGREEVRSYGGEVLTARATDVSRDGEDGFRVELVGGHSIVARRVLAATGLVDEIPDIDGLARHWGGDVLHCPFCHGYEVRDQRIVLIVTHPLGLHPAPLWRQLSAQLTIVRHGSFDLDAAPLDALQAAGVTVRPGPVERVITGDDGHVTAVELASGERIEADAVAIGAGFRVRVEPFLALGLKAAAHVTGMGDLIETDPTGATSVPGLYAAGNLTDPSQQVLQAAAQGSRVGAMIGFSLAEEDLQAAARTATAGAPAAGTSPAGTSPAGSSAAGSSPAGPSAAGSSPAGAPAAHPSANEADWNHRYRGRPMWSGNPNGSLVNEIIGLPAGRALDVGAGEGGDAIWLAEQGWQVTASDISTVALNRVRAEADRRRLDVKCAHADANASAAFPAGAFDLVSAQYASIPRTSDGRAVGNLMAAVAPGGTLLIVSHDIEPMRAPTDPGQTSRPFDADAYVRVEDFADALTAAAGWEVVVHEKRTRPPGSATAAHHVEDVILRARRTT